MWENSEFKVEFSKCDMKEFEKERCCLPGNAAFLCPWGLWEVKMERQSVTDCSGFSPLSMYRIERTEDALYLLEQVLLILGKAVEYLITPANITLTTDNGFLQQRDGRGQNRLCAGGR